MGEVSPSPVQPAIEFLTTLVIAFAIGHLVAGLGITQVRGALRLAALLWIAFPGMLWVGAMLWENTPWQFAALHGGDWLIKCMLVTLIISIGIAHGRSRRGRAIAPGANQLYTKESQMANPYTNPDEPGFNPAY